MSARSEKWPKTFGLAACLLTTIGGGCNNSTFTAQERRAPAVEAIVHKSAACNVARRDLALVAGDWRRCARENIFRLELSRCNYLDYAIGLETAGKQTVTADKRCVELRKP